MKKLAANRRTSSLLSFALCVLPFAFSLPGAASTVRIGVFGLFRPVELVVRPAAGEVLIVDAGEEELLLEGAQSARLRLRERSVECIARGRAVAGTSVRVGSHQGSAGFLLSVPGKIERRFRGSLEVIAAPASLAAVVTMDREAAVASAVTAESPPGAGFEAMKAQAIVTRSYYAAAHGRHVGFEFCDTTHCQFLRELPGPENAASLATAATRGLVLAYRGEPFPALFSASCGGRTRSLPNPAAGGYPYFSVECSYCLRRAERWERRLDVDRDTLLLTKEPSETLRLRLGRKLGWSAIPGDNYQVTRDGDKVFVRGSGAGHGLGLCQAGAAAMAAEGDNFRQILEHYFPNTSLISQ